MPFAVPRPPEFTLDQQKNFHAVFERLRGAKNLPTRQTQRAAAMRIARRMLAEAKKKLKDKNP